jgi:hypothetical protein
MTSGSRLLTCFVILGVTASEIYAQVDCTDPDLLCTGDPCVIPRIRPADPCVVDFGARDVVIEGLADIGTVSLTAKSFTVEGSIGGGQNPGGSRPNLELNASEGVVLDGAIRLTTFNQDPQVRVVAAGSIDANAPITLISNLPTSQVGEVVLLDSGADLAVRGPIRTKNAKSSLPVTLAAAGRIDLLASLRVDDDLLLDAGTDLVLDGSIVLRRKTGIFETPDGVAATAGGSIEVLDKLRLLGGAVTLEGGGDVFVRQSIKSRKAQESARCEGITIRSTGGNVLLDDQVECSGRQAQGPLSVEASGDITVNDRLKTTSNVNTGGAVSLASSSGTVSVTSSIDARGQFGGDVVVTANRIELTGSGVDTRSRGHTGGAQQYTATAGDLLLSGRFLATDAGEIEGSATGNLTASGVFRAGAGGCIGLAAGGVLDTSGASFDPALSPSCP